MAFSPAKAHFLRVTAAQEAAATAPHQGMEGANAYELQLAQLYQDRSRLKNIQSGEGKAALKVELLPAYQPYISGVLQAGKGAQDEVVTTVMLWRIDAGDYAGALDIANYVLAHDLVMPDRFARTAAASSPKRSPRPRSRHRRPAAASTLRPCIAPSCSPTRPTCPTKPARSSTSPPAMPPWKAFLWRAPANPGRCKPASICSSARSNCTTSAAGRRIWRPPNGSRRN